MKLAHKMFFCSQSQCLTWDAASAGGPFCAWLKAELFDRKMGAWGSQVWHRTAFLCPRASLLLSLFLFLSDSSSSSSLLLLLVMRVSSSDSIHLLLPKYSSSFFLNLAPRLVTLLDMVHTDLWWPKEGLSEGNSSRDLFSRWNSGTKIGQRFFFSHSNDGFVFS